MIDSITVYLVKNGFIVVKNDDPRTLLLSPDPVVFREVGSEYSSTSLAGYLRDWQAEKSEKTVCQEVVE